jgi:hypothetical protein
MPRPLRIEYEGAICHVMNRGDRREPIFRDRPAGRQVTRIESGSSKPSGRLHASLDFKSQIADRRFLPGGAYTARFNRRHKLFGHLFSGRYKALLVDAASPGYFHAVCEYVHLNPVPACAARQTGGQSC